MSSQESQPQSLVTTALIVVSVIFPVLSAVSVGLRFFARRAGDLPLLADDWGIVSTWIITFGLSINAWVFGSMMGIDHYKINPLLGESKGAQCLWTQSLILQVSFTLVKLSILLFYKRIFATRTFRIAVYIAMTLIVIWGLIFFFLVIFQVDPVSTAWTGEGRFTIDATAFGLAQAGTSIGLDVVVLIFPLPVIARLHMRTSRKVAVSLILWLGVFCVVAAIVRLVLLKQSLASVTNSHDSGYSQIALESKAYIFTIIEPNCSVIAACLPCLGPIFKVRSQRSKSSSDKRSNPVKPTNGNPSRNGSALPLHKQTEHGFELNNIVNPWSRELGEGSVNTVFVERLPQAQIGPSGLADDQIEVTKTYGLTTRPREQQA